MIKAKKKYKLGSMKFNIKRALYAAHGANDIYWLILPIVLPRLLDKFGASYAEAGLLLSVYLMVNGVSSYFVGKLSDYGPSKSILIGASFLLASTCMIAAGLAANWIIFLILLVVTGIFVGAYHPLGYVLIEEFFYDEKRQLLPKYEIAGIGSVMVMVLINGFLIETIGLIGVLLVATFPGYIMGLVFLVARKKFIVSDKAVHKDSGKPKPDSLSASVMPALTIGRPLFMVFLSVVFLRAFSSVGVNNFITTYIYRGIGLPEDIAIYFTALIYGGGIFGSLLIGFATRKLKILPVMLPLTILIVVTIFLISQTTDVAALVALIFLFGAASSALVICQNIMTGALSGGLGKGESYGLLMTFSTLANALSPLAFGALTDRRGFFEALRLYTLPVLASFVVLLIFSLVPKIRTSGH